MTPARRELAQVGGKVVVAFRRRKTGQGFASVSFDGVVVQRTGTTVDDAIARCVQTYRSQQATREARSLDA